MYLFQREPQDDLFSLTGDEYLQKFNVKCYLNDMVRLLLESRDEKPLEFISEYFLTVMKGTHVTHRGYDYIRATHHNRAAFCMLLRMVFDPQDFPGGLKIEDFAQLVYLMCPDMPYYIFKRVYSVAAEDDSLPALMQAMGVYVYYAEFFSDLDAALQPMDGLVPRELLTEGTAAQLLVPKTRDGDAPEEAQPLPPKDVITLAFKNAMQRADSSSDVPTGKATLDHVHLELYLSSGLFQSISQRHPSLHASLLGGRTGGGVDSLVSSVLQSHDAMVASGRLRRLKSVK